jgi:nucleotide-binding universal stress UspA family protein
MRVLLATDGEDHSLAAERLLIRLGDRRSVEATVLSVAVYNIDPDDPSTRSVESAREISASRAEDAAKRLTDAGFTADTVGAEGDPGAEIVRKAEEEGFDLVVLGSGRHTWLSERLLGTTSSYALHNAPCSVLIVRGTEDGDSPLRVLIATDGSEHAKEAVRTFVDLADRARYEVMVVAVAQPDRDSAQEHVDEMVGSLADQGIVAAGEVHEGSPAGTILQLAEKTDRDLVVLGSLGRGPVRRALLGSVSDHVARHARASLVARRVT